MHPLTKMFIVLQALLSVLVAALVIPFAVNDDNWKTRYEAQAADVIASKAAERDATTNLSRQAAMHTQQVAELESQLNQVRQRAEDLRHQLVKLRTERDEAVNRAAGISSQITSLTSTAETQSEIIDTQAEEITSRREESLRLKQRAIELEDQLRDVTSQLDVAVDAQRLLQERIERLREQLEGRATGDGEPGGENETDLPPIASPKVVGRVIDVDQRQTGDVFAVVDLGQRDGLQAGMRFLISRDGVYKATLVITTVDINRSSGYLEFVQGEVQPNDRVTGGVDT